MRNTMNSIRAASLVGLALFGTSVSASRQPVPSWTGCPPGGPLLPRPTDLSGSQAVQDATADLARALDSAIDGKSKAGFPVDNTSFSIALVSPFDQVARDEDSSIIWTYHHLGKNNVNGTKDLDNDSQYLIGSVSKVFTDLLLLKSDVSLSDPVTKYLPGLEKEGSPIQWSNITLSALSNHLAGIPSNLRMSINPTSCSSTRSNRSHLSSSVFRVLRSSAIVQYAGIPYAAKGRLRILRCGRA